MALLTITNLTTSDVCIGDLYTSVPASSSITVDRAASQIPAMKALIDAVAASSVAVSVAYTAAELASGMAQPPASIEAVDLAPVAAADVAAPILTFRKAFTAGVAGTADDVTIFAANALPYKIRVLDAYAIVSAISAGGGALLQVRDQAAGAGTLLAEMSSGATGRAGQTATVTASGTATPGTTIGLFIHRLNRDAAGEVVILARRES